MIKNLSVAAVLVLAVALAFTGQQIARANGMSPSSVSPDLLSRSWSVDPGALPPLKAKCIAGEWPAVRGTSDAHPGGDSGQRKLDFDRAKAAAPAGWDGVWYYISGTPTQGEGAGLVGCINAASLMVLRHQAAADVLDLRPAADVEAELKKALDPLAGRVTALERRSPPTREEFDGLTEMVGKQGEMLTDHEARIALLEKALSITGAYAGVQATVLPMNHRAVEWVVGARPLTFIPYTRGWLEWSGGGPIRRTETSERIQAGAVTLGLSLRVERFPLGDLILEAGFHRRQFQDEENWAVYQLTGGRGCANWAPPLWSWVKKAPEWAEKTEGMVSVCLEGGNATDFKNIETTHVGGSVGLQGSFGH